MKEDFIKNKEIVLICGDYIRNPQLRRDLSGSRCKIGRERKAEIVALINNFKNSIPFQPLFF